MFGLSFYQGPTGVSGPKGARGAQGAPVSNLNKQGYDSQNNLFFFFFNTFLINASFVKL